MHDDLRHHWPWLPVLGIQLQRLGEPVPPDTDCERRLLFSHSPTRAAPLLEPRAPHVLPSASVSTGTSAAKAFRAAALPPA